LGFFPEFLLEGGRSLALGRRGERSRARCLRCSTLSRPAACANTRHDRRQRIESHVLLSLLPRCRATYTHAKQRLPRAGKSVLKSATWIFSAPLYASSAASSSRASAPFHGRPCNHESKSRSVSALHRHQSPCVCPRHCKPLSKPRSNLRYIAWRGCLMTKSRLGCCWGGWLWWWARAV